MSSSISYTMAMSVSGMWDDLKAIDDFEQVVGGHIFERLFQLNKNASALFKLEGEGDVRERDGFQAHAHVIVDMIDCVVQFLGPNIDSLEQFLMDVGKRHVMYGARPEDITDMSKAAIYAIETVMGSRFTMQDLEEWTTVFTFLTSKMVEGMTR